MSKYYLLIVGYAVRHCKGCSTHFTQERLAGWSCTPKDLFFNIHQIPKGWLFCQMRRGKPKSQTFDKILFFYGNSSHNCVRMFGWSEEERIDHATIITVSLCFFFFLSLTLPYPRELTILVICISVENISEKSSEKRRASYLILLYQIFFQFMQNFKVIFKCII